MAIEEIIAQNEIFSKKMIGKRVKIFTRDPQWRDVRERFVMNNNSVRETTIKQGGLGTIIAIDTASPYMQNNQLKFFQTYVVKPDHYTSEENGEIVENTLGVSLLLIPGDRLETVPEGQSISIHY